MRAHVEVVMSTYNGARHLSAQIDSILAQVGVTVHLTVRDDGSSDATPEVLARYGMVDDRVHVMPAGRAGLPGAYFQLIEVVGTDPEFVALADQDDVWLPTKLQRAVELLSAQPDREEPLMYCSRVTVTDELLRPLSDKPLPRRPLSFANALTQNYATGCTIVLNRAARKVLLRRWPRYAVMHDAWLYLVVSGTGRVLYDAESTVLYRQHGANAVGIGRTPIGRVFRRVRRQLSEAERGGHSRQNNELANTHKDLLRPEPGRLLAEYLRAQIGLRRRLVYALTGQAYRQTRGSDLIFRLLIALGRA